MSACLSVQRTGPEVYSGPTDCSNIRLDGVCLYMQRSLSLSSVCHLSRLGNISRKTLPRG